MTFRVLVCGSTDYDRADRVRFILNRLAFQHGPLSVFDLGGAGADAGARWYRHARVWGGDTIWHLTAFDDARPDYVLSFGQDDRSVIDKARAAGITVGEVP